MDASSATALFSNLEDDGVEVIAISESDLSEDDDHSERSDYDESADSSNSMDDKSPSSDGGSDDQDGAACDDDDESPNRQRKRRRSRSCCAPTRNRGARGRSTPATRGSRAQCAQGRGRRRGRSSAATSNRGNASSHSGRNSAPKFVAMWDKLDPNPQSSPDFAPPNLPGPVLPDDFSGIEEFDFFKLYFTRCLVDALVKYTNEYARHHIPNYSAYGDKNGAWVDTDSREML